MRRGKTDTMKEGSSGERTGGGEEERGGGGERKETLQPIIRVT